MTEDQKYTGLSPLSEPTDADPDDYPPQDGQEGDITDEDYADDA